MPIGDRSENGGTMPARTSLIIPPPTAVATDNTAIPKISIFFASPTVAPDTAKAIVPRISKMTHVSDMIHLYFQYLKKSQNRINDFHDRPCIYNRQRTEDFPDRTAENKNHEQNKTVAVADIMIMPCPFPGKKHFCNF